MVIKADLNLIEKIKKEEKMLVYVFCAISFIVILYGTFMYLRDSGVFFLIDIAIFLIMASLFLYVAIIRQAKLISNTIVEIVDNDSSLKFKTTAFNVLLFYKLKSDEFVIEKKNLNLMLTDYPLERTFKTKKKVFKLIFRDRIFYFLPEFFNPSLLKDAGMLLNR